MHTSFYIRPAQHEQIETSAVLRTAESPVLLGTVLSADGKPIADALAVLYASGGTQPDRIAGVSFSDEMGRFAFGPLDAGVLYQVCIHADTMVHRVLEQPE